MFGLVQRPIWSRSNPPDEKNRIPMVARSLLIQLDDGRHALIDTGCGDPAGFSDKERSLQKLSSDWPLLSALAEQGLSPEQIDLVLCTHLHWDHAGGLCRFEDGKRVLMFPNATVYVGDQEWQDARSGNPLLYKSYPESIQDTLDQIPPERLVRVCEECVDLFPGITLRRSGGHTQGHCSYHLSNARMVEALADADPLHPCQEWIFAGDVLSVREHLRLVFQTAYDTFPLETRAWKQQWLPQAAAAGWGIILDHSPREHAIWIEPDAEREYKVVESL